MKGKFSKFKKIFFSETISGMKLKLGIHAFDISLYINWVFSFRSVRILVALTTYIFHRLIMGTVKIVIFSVSMEILGT